MLRTIGITDKGGHLGAHHTGIKSAGQHPRARTLT